MIDSGLFGERFLRKWEKKPENEKTWATMKAYFKEEYDDIKMFGEPTNRQMETINSATEGMEYWRKFDAMQWWGTNRFSKWPHPSKEQPTH
jgi:hypothetical protein